MFAEGSLVLDSAWILTLLLVSLRLSATLIMTPIIAAPSVPTMIRILVVLALALVLTIGFPQWRAPVPTGLGPLIAAALTELALGATMGLGILAAFGAFDVGGRLLDVQIGYGIAQVLDPITRHQQPILSTALNQLAVVFFFLSNGHHLLLRGLAYSFERFPPGSASLASTGAAVFKHMSGLFSLGFVLVAPVIFCILLIEFALGVLTRNLPQMHIFAMAHSVKIFVGLAALSLWLAGAGGVMTRIYQSIFQTWEAAFQ
jgi:flagellar biosynthetic protein FliR